jgi:hypothetical protein
VDLGFVNAAEWARVLHTADTLLLIAEPSALALGMLERSSTPWIPPASIAPASRSSSIALAKTTTSPS